MQTNLKDIEELNKNGFLIKRSFLKEEDIEKIKSIILKNNEGKSSHGTIYPSNFLKVFLKFFKCDFNKALHGIYFLSLKKKLLLDDYASIFFNHKSKLLMIDGYYNNKSSKDILPWHCDQAYSGAKYVSTLNSPNHFFLKFFFYLTDVGPNNGCTSYIPGSHKIIYAIRSCLFEKKIDYQPYWSLHDIVKIIIKKENYNFILQKLDSENLLKNFLKNAEKCIQNNLYSEFDFSAKPGDAIIFNECGVHKGSNPTLNDRVVLRYLYS